jgi:hypothetical protein
MKSKRSFKRSHQSQSSTAADEQSAASENPTAETELLKFLQWDKELHPASVAIIASHLDREAGGGESRKAQHGPRQARREVLVRAALLLREARDIVTNGPSFEDLPSDLQLQFLDEVRISPLAEAWGATTKLPTPNKRFRARAKIITGQKKTDRAEAYLQEYLKHQCKEAGNLDAKAAWNEFVRDLEVENTPFDMAFNHLLSFPKWKQNHKSEAARESRRKGLEKKVASPA